ncbi:MAG: CRISPR-associated protein Cas4 [Anaerolineae bacterium]|nr:CRISPR-associated protein Cas4 [Anaerolineae bacterium]
MDEGVEVPWRVTDLKQYVYCARILYYYTCLPRVRPTTYKMEASLEAHAAAEDLEQRRSLRSYGLKGGERHFSVSLASERLGMRGQVDMVIETESGGQRELIPVDYKLSDKVAEHFQLQLTAYAVMLEDTWGEAVRRGFLYLIPLRQAREVRITSRLRSALDEALAAMNAMLLREEMPPPTRHRAKCVACEFRRFCNDVV